MNRFCAAVALSTLAAPLQCKCDFWLGYADVMRSVARGIHRQRLGTS
jgi:hypothetical protein